MRVFLLYPIQSSFDFRLGPLVFSSMVGTAGPVYRRYGVSAPVPLVRPSQARKLNRSNGNFCSPRAQWPGGNLDRHSDFARRKDSACPKG